MYTGVFQKPHLYIHDSGHDSPRFIPMRAKVKSRFILIEIQLIVVSHDAPGVSARYIYGPTTLHGGSATIHHDGFATVLVWFWPAVPRHSPHAVFLMNRDESE